MTAGDAGDVLDRYRAQLHRLQSLIRWRLTREAPAYESTGRVPDSQECSPKHLRVGVDSALAGAEALCQLLVEKGVFSADEYAAALLDAVTARADERELAERAINPRVRFQ